jgi:hypothetical protein
MQAEPLLRAQRHFAARGVLLKGMMNRRTALLVLLLASPGRSASQELEVTLVREGKAAMTLFAGSAAGPVEDLRRTLKEISGADLVPTKAEPGAAGLYVGLASDFPGASLEKADELGPEGFVLRTDGKSLFLLGREAAGVHHAVSSFLHRLGCRWFFPGKTWEVIPRLATIRGSWNERQVPSFGTERLIWHGFGDYRPCHDDFKEWERHNRMGGALPVSIGHTWHGLNPDKDFKEHPEWFALVAGQRKASKPCYSHPDVLRRAIDHALKEAASGKTMISMSPPDGLGYCECDKCAAVFQGGTPFQTHGTTFAKRPDGVIVNITSETLFRMVSDVAQAVAEKHPKTLVGCYAYSAYSHPPSFKLHPNVFLQTTTAYRRTPLTLEEQLKAFGEKTSQVGIREYFSVYQWDWDGPHPGPLEPAKLQKSLRLYRENNGTSVNAEASNNWGPRGLGYYVASRLLWDVNADVRAIVRDFYEKAFGPAAAPMERYYARWYGSSVAMQEAAPAQEEGEKKPSSVTAEDLRAAFRDLDEAAALVKDLAGPRERVDHLRMYAHYLHLRRRVEDADKGRDEKAILEAVRAETVFGGRLTRTNMIHSRALLGKAFLRRFKKFEKILSSVPEAQHEGKGWRQVGDPPGREELDRLWAEDKAGMKIQ